MLLKSKVLLKKIDLLIGCLVFFSVLGVAYRSIFLMPPEISQGEVYKILYIHVPSAFCAFFSSFLLCVLSVLFLKTRKKAYLDISRASAEIGLMFTVCTLVTGSIWGKATWGTWWTWDARITTTFLLGLMYCGYLLLWITVRDVEKRGVFASVLGILIFCDVPIIYKSVIWWRTLHQPPSLFSGDENTMSLVIYNQLMMSSFTLLVGCLWLIWQRTCNIRLQSKVDEHMMQSL